MTRRGPKTYWVSFTDLTEYRVREKSHRVCWRVTECSHILTKSTEFIKSRIFSPSSRSRYYFSHRVFCRKLTESPSPPSHGFSHRVRDRVNFPESGGLTKMKWNKMKFEMLPVTIATLACVRNIFVFLFHCILSLSFISSVSSRLYEVSWTKDRDECTAMTSLTWNQLLL